MNDNNQQFVLLSGVITQDEENRSVNLSLDDNFTLICKSYEIVLNNTIKEILPLSGIPFRFLGRTGMMRIKASGTVTPDSYKSFYALLREISSRKNPFTLNLGEQSFEKVLHESFETSVDRYGKAINCSLVFAEI